MMMERDFWIELDRLLLQSDMIAAAELVNEHLESFHNILKDKFDAAKNRQTLH